jgi:MFS family permease
LSATAPASAAGPASGLLSPRAGFFLLASITISFLAGSMAPTPLYPVYQAQWGFSALTVTEIFGVYALALLLTLLVAGRVSDHIGRRPVLIAATLAQAVVMLMFATADGVGSLFLARIVQGIATGAALGAVGAGMLDLDKVHGPLANAIAPPLGTGFGGLLTGLLVHFLPAPTLLVYLLLAAVFVVQALGVIFMAETVSRRAGALASLAPQFSVPQAARKPLLLAVPVLVASWSLAGFYGAMAPALMRTVLGLDPSLASGIAAFALAGSGAVSVLALRHAAPRGVMAFGAFALLAGTVLSALALTGHSIIGFFVGSVVAGAGFGAGFQGAMRTVVPTAKPHERAGLLSVIFVVSYLAMGVPAMVAGFFISHGSQLLPTAQCFAAVVAILAGFAALGSVRDKLASQYSANASSG